MKTLDKTKKCDACENTWEYSIEKQGLKIRLCETCFNNLERY